MGEVTGIKWCDHTFNPWVGCQKVSPACDHCYAETWANRYKRVKWGPGEERERTSVHNWNDPRRWDKKAAEDGVRRKVFCASLADVFDNHVNPDWRADLWELIRQTPNLDWLLLTKRPQNAKKMLPADWMTRPWLNVWFGTTVENQEEADRRIPHLTAIPAMVHFLSCEPLLGRLDLSPHLGGVDWLICGGESGPGARPMSHHWARALQTQCIAAGIPFFFKQWGEWLPHGQRLANDKFNTHGKPGSDKWHDWGTGETAWRVGSSRSGNLLDGQTIMEFPQ